MTIVNVFCSKFSLPIQHSLWHQYLDSLPVALQQKCKRYVKWQDQHACVIGKLLLAEGLKKLEYKGLGLFGLEYNQYGRPFLTGNIDFNISHSGEYVLCAISEKIKLGLDVQKKINVNFKNFIHVMTPEQWHHIYSSKDSYEQFFRLWTIKESVIKAEGKGLSIPLTDIQINQYYVRCLTRKWFVKELILDKNYSCFIATNIQDFEVKFIDIDFHKGIR